MRTGIERGSPVPMIFRTSSSRRTLSISPAHSSPHWTTGGEAAQPAVTRRIRAGPMRVISGKEDGQFLADAHVRQLLEQDVGELRPETLGHAELRLVESDVLVGRVEVVHHLL